MLLEVEGVDAYYGPSHVLHGISLHVAEQEVLGVVGRNGMGKTTLLHAIAGLHPVREGGITMRGRPLRGLAPERVWGEGVTLVPQGHRVFGSLSVGDNLRVALRERSGGWSIDEVCDRFDVLRERWDQRAGSLSGGQQQMLAIARALVGNGELVLMDEPSEGLDPQRTAVVADVVQELRRRGTAVLLVEQKVGLVLRVADRVHVIDRGAVTFAASAAELRDAPDVLPRRMGLA